MTLRELIIALKNLEGVGANRGDLGGGDRRIVCFGIDECFYLTDVEIMGGDVVLHLSDEEP